MNIVLFLVGAFGIMFAMALVFLGCNLFYESVIHKFTHWFERAGNIIISVMCVVGGFCLMICCVKSAIDIIQKF